MTKLILNDLQIFSLKDGDLLHCLKKSDSGYKNFGEVYFSEIKKNHIKAWKRHKQMTLNLVVPVGKIKFNFIEFTSNNTISRHEIILSKDNYKRITVPPGIVFGFKGISENNILANITDIIHDDLEVESIDISKYEFI